MPRKARIGSPGWTGQIALNELTSEQAQPSKWADVDEDALSDDRRELFLRRKQAVLDYFRGASEKQIKERWGIGRSHVYRLITERCLLTSHDGTLFGWRGLIPHMRINAWMRQSPPTIDVNGGGSAGSLQWLFATPANAGLESDFRTKILSTPTGLQGTRRPKLGLLTWFYGRLREKGIERRGEWPFNTERMGYTTICRFINTVLAENPTRQRSLLGGANAEKKALAGDGTNRPRLTVFQRVEADAHKLDVRMVVMVPSPHGGYEPRKVHRLWVIVIIEVVSRSVLGYYLSMRREVAAEDVLRAIRNALGGWSRRSLSFGNIAYSNDAALPSGMNPRYLGACWDEFSVDGALANVCDRVESRLREVVDCIVIKPQDPNSFSSRRSLDDRPFIETFFRVLAGGGTGLHGLSMSTKSSPEALKGDGDPAVKAHALQFQVEYLHEVLDVIIANYNATPHHGIGYRTPLAQLNFLCGGKDAVRIRTADPRQVARLGTTRKLCTLLGGVTTGRRPYFNFENARYSSESLMQRPDLLNGKFWLAIENEDDARFATVSSQEGLYICTVRAAPPWHNMPHSLYVRRAIRALDIRRIIHLSKSNDAVTELIKYCEEQKNKKLPVHPAYLEQRRILQSYADNISINPFVDPIACDIHSFTDPSEKESLNDGMRISEGVEKTSIPDEKVLTGKAAPQAGRPLLPPMRKAKTW